MSARDWLPTWHWGTEPASWPGLRFYGLCWGFFTCGKWVMSRELSRALRAERERLERGPR